MSWQGPQKLVGRWATRRRAASPPLDGWDWAAVSTGCAPNTRTIPINTISARDLMVLPPLARLGVRRTRRRCWIFCRTTIYLCRRNRQAPEPPHVGAEDPRVNRAGTACGNPLALAVPDLLRSWFAVTAFRG